MCSGPENEAFLRGASNKDRNEERREKKVSEYFITIHSTYIVICHNECSSHRKVVKPMLS